MMKIRWGRFLLVFLLGTFISLFVDKTTGNIAYFILAFIFDPIEFNSKTSKGKHAA